MINNTHIKLILFSLFFLILNFNINSTGIYNDKVCENRWYLAKRDAQYNTKRDQANDFCYDWCDKHGFKSTYASYDEDKTCRYIEGVDFGEFVACKHIYCCCTSITNCTPYQAKCRKDGQDYLPDNLKILGYQNPLILNCTRIISTGQSENCSLQGSGLGIFGQIIPDTDFYKAALFKNSCISAGGTVEEQGCQQLPK